MKQYLKRESENFTVYLKIDGENHSCLTKLSSLETGSRIYTFWEEALDNPDVNEPITEIEFIQAVEEAITFLKGYC